MTDDYECPAFVFFTRPQKGDFILNISTLDGEITRYRLSKDQMIRIARESVPLALDKE